MATYTIVGPSPLASSQGGTGATTSTGSAGSLVLTTSPTLVTPTLGAATATSIAFSPTTGGIVGTTAADDAGSGYYGEFFYSNIPLGSAVSLTSNTGANVTSIAVTAGDYDAYGLVAWQLSAAGTLSNAAARAFVSSTSATSPGNYQNNAFTCKNTQTDFSAPVIPTRFSFSGSSTIYLVCNVTFTSGTCVAYGTLSIRRRR